MVVKSLPYLLYPKGLLGGLNEVTHANISAQQKGCFIITLTSQRHKSPSFHYPGVLAKIPPSPGPTLASFCDTT